MSIYAARKTFLISFDATLIGLFKMLEIYIKGGMTATSRFYNGGVCICLYLI